MSMLCALKCSCECLNFLSASDLTVMFSLSVGVDLRLSIDAVGSTAGLFEF